MGGKTAYPSNWIWRFSFERGFDATEGPGALQPWHYVTAASVCDWNDMATVFDCYGKPDLENCPHLRQARLLPWKLPAPHFDIIGHPRSGIGERIQRLDRPASQARRPDSQSGGILACPDRPNYPADRQRRTKHGRVMTLNSSQKAWTYSTRLTTRRFQNAKNWLVKQYGGHKFDVVVAIGPDTIRFLANHASKLFSGVPIVICGSSLEQAGTSNLDSRFTGTWQRLEPGKTLEAALRLFPNTRHVFVVGGSSAYDRIGDCSYQRTAQLFPSPNAILLSG